MKEQDNYSTPISTKSSEQARWHEYERQKRRLQRLCLDPAEYDRQIRRITKELNL